MASESLAADQSIDEHEEEKKVGDVSKCVDGEDIIFQPKEGVGKDEADNNKEEGLTGMASTTSVSEEKLEPSDVSVSDVTKSEEQHEKIGEVGNSLQDSELSNSSEPAIETNERNLQSQADDAHEKLSEVQEKTSDFVETFAIQKPAISESKTEDLTDTKSKPTFENERKPEEAPLVSAGFDVSEYGNVEAETQEAANPTFSKEKVDIDLIKAEDSNKEFQVLVPAEIPNVVVPDSSGTPEKNDVDSSNLANIEVPVKDLEIESGSPEEQKSKESAEIKKPSTNVSTNDAGGEVGSSSYEVTPAGVSDVVENKDDGLEVMTMPSSIKIHEDLEAEPELVQAESEENVTQGVDVKKDDEIVEGSIETSAVSDDVPPLAKVSSEEEKASEPGVVVEEEEDTSLESDNIDTVTKGAEVSLEGDEMVDKENIVNAETVEKDLVDSITDLAEAEGSSDQVKAPTPTEIVNEALEVTAKELNIAPEASEVFSEGDKISAGDEKNCSLNGEAATSVEAPKDITTVEESLDQVIEEKKCESPSEDKLADKEKYVNEEAKEINLQSQADVTDQTPSVVHSDFVETEPVFSESITEDLKDTEIEPISENERKPEEATSVSTGVGLSEDGNVEAETQEAANTELSKDKADIELIKSEDSKDGIHVLVPAKISTLIVPDTYEAPEKNDNDSSNLTSIKVPVKNLEVESGSPEEQKSNESTETKEPSSNVSALDAAGEVVESSSYEAKPSGVAEVIEKKNDGSEAETIQSSVINCEDLEAKPDLAQTPFDEIVSGGVKQKKDDEIVEDGIEVSTVPYDIPLLDKDSYDEEKASEPGVVVEEGEGTSLEGDSINTVPKVAEASLEGGNVLEEDKLVDKEEVVNAETVERDLADTITDPAKAEVSSDETLEVISKEVNTAPEVSEVPSEGDEKSESLKDEAATSVEELNDITTVEEPLDQVIEEKKSETSISETQTPSEDKLVDKDKDVNEEAKEINLQSQSDDADETTNVVQSDFAEASTSSEPVFSESKNEDLKNTEIKPSEDERKPVEAPLVSTGLNFSADGIVEAETQEATNPESSNLESSNDKVDVELIKSEDSKDEIPTVVLPDASEANDVNSSYLTSIEVPVKDLEVESGSPEEQKPKDNAEAVEPSSNVSTIDAGGEVVGSSYEGKLSGNSEVVDKKDDGLEVETIQSSVEIHDNLKAKPELTQTQTDENVSERVEVNKDDEIFDGGIATSTVSDDVAPLAKVSSEDEKAVEPGVVVEEGKASLEGDNIGTVAEISLEGENVLEGDKLVDKVKVVNDLYSTFLDPTNAEVSSDQVIAPATTEIVKEESVGESLELTSKDLNIAPVASEVSSELDKFSAGDEDESDCLVAGDATSVEAPKDIIAIKESLDQLVKEKKSESSVNEIVARTEDKLVDEEKNVNIEDEERDLINASTNSTAVEASSEQVKAPEIVEEESNKQALEETSKDLNTAPEAGEVPSEVDKFPVADEGKSDCLIDGDATSVETPKDIIAIKESLDQLVKEKKSESSVSEIAVPEVSSEKGNAPEIFEERNKQALEVTSKELNIAPEASEGPSEDDKLSAGEEKSESLKGEAATSVETPENITTDKESLDEAIEEKSESSISEREAPVEDKLVDKEKNVNEEVEERDLGDTSTDPTAAEVSSKQAEASETAEIVKEGSNKQASEVTSKELSIDSKAGEVPSEADEVSAGDEEKRESLKGEHATLVEAPKDIKIAEDSPDQVIIQKKSEGSKSEIEALVQDKFVDSEKDVNAEAEKTELVDTPTDPSTAEVFSEQVKVAETAEIVNDSDKEALELTSNEVHNVPEASEVPSEGDKVSSGEEEKSESLKGKDAASLEAPKDIAAAEKPIDQLIEENKIESSKNETEAPIETTRDFDTSKLLPKAVKDIIASEAVQEKQDEASNDLSLEEKKATDFLDKKDEAKIEGTLQDATDQREQAELKDEKAESEKSKDQDPIVSSATGDAKLTKEATKRESSIFSKVKRTIVKAKKAILRKSPGPKTLSSEPNT